MRKSLVVPVWLVLFLFPAISSFAAEPDMGSARELLSGGNFAGARDLLLRSGSDSTGEAAYLLALSLLGAGDLPGVSGLDSAAALFERSARAGYRYPDQPWAYPGIDTERYTKANKRSPERLLRSKKPADRQTACNLLWNVIAAEPHAESAAEMLGKELMKAGRMGEALSLYTRLLAALPPEKDGLYDAQQDFLELSTPKQAEPLLRYLAPRSPDSLSPLEDLMAARAYFALGGKQDSLACRHYFRGLDRLDVLVAADLWRDIKDLAGDTERKEYVGTAELTDKQAFFRRFWRSREFMPGEDNNQRLIEHYRRLNYARRLFDAPVANGYDDMGKIYIRHGEPDQRVRESSGNGTYDSESWLYRKRPADFIFHFVRKYTGAELTDDLSSAIRPGNNDEDVIALMLSKMYEDRAELDARYFTMAMDLKDIEQPAAMRLIKAITDNHEIVSEGMIRGENSETYNPFRGIKPLDYYYSTADFMSADTTSTLYIFYGVPVYLLESRESAVNYECAYALYDRNWDQAARSAGDRQVRLERKPGDYGKGTMLVHNQSISLAPGRYKSTVSVKDRNSERLGLYRDSVEVTAYPHESFGVSAVVLATGIEEAKPGAGGRFTRGGLNISVLPSRTFTREQKAFLYCEIYNIHADSEGHKDYRVELSVSAEKLDKGMASRIFSPIGRLIGKKEDSNSVTLTFEKRQSAPERMLQQEYFSLDIGDSSPGKYALRLTVTDMAGGGSITRTNDFYVVKAD